MDEVRVKSRLFLFILAANLFHVSLGEPSQLVISFSNDDLNKVTLECHDDFNTAQPATFTFRNPTGMEESSNTTTVDRKTLTFSIRPENETIVSCTTEGFTESKRVAITAIPRYPNNSAIRQYVFTDNSTVKLECPLSLGRLHGLLSSYYDFSWIVNNSYSQSVVTPNGTYQLSDFNRLLQVQLPLSLPTAGYSFQCRGRIRHCNSSITICDQPVAPNYNAQSPLIELNFVDPVNITVPPSAPSDDTVVQGEKIFFTCTASGADDLSFKWQVDGDNTSCSSDNSICSTESGDSNGGKTSTLTINTNNVAPVKNVTVVTVVCMVNQMLNVGPSVSNEIRLPNITSRDQSSDLVQFRISPAPPFMPQSTPPPTGAPPTNGKTAPAAGSSLEHYYIITAIVGAFILFFIIVLSFCIVCIFRYHFKNKESHLGRMLRRQFSRDPSAQMLKYTRREPSPRQIEEQHFKGTDTPPILYTNTDVYLGNGNHHLGPIVSDQNHIYNISQNSGVSGVSSYSGLSGVSQNHGHHEMPHYKEPSLVYQEGTGVHLGVPPGAVGGGNGVLYTDFHSMGSRKTSDTSVSRHSGQSLNQQQLPQLYPSSAHHGSCNVLPSHQCQHSVGPNSTSLPHMQYVGNVTPPNLSVGHHLQQPLDPLSSLPVLSNGACTYSVYPPLATSQPVMTEGAYSGNPNHSQRSSGHQSPASSIQHQSPHLQPHSYVIPAAHHPQPHYISRNDLLTVELALMHNRHCQIPGCCCYKVREIMESRGYRPAPYDSPEMGSISSSGTSGSGSSRGPRVNHRQQSSTDSDSDYGSGSDRRSRPPNLKLLRDDINRNPNLHPHYHLTTKSYLRRVSSQHAVDHRRSKSLSDLTPVTEMPETQTPAKTPAVGGSIKQDTPVYDCKPTLGEDVTKQTARDDYSCHPGHPALLREISISADNIPALCLNDCPFTPSPLKEGREQLSLNPNRTRRRGTSFKRGSLRNAQSKLGTVNEKTSSVETDDSNTSSHSSHTDTAVKLSDNDGIVVEVKGHPPKEQAALPLENASADDMWKLLLTAEPLQNGNSSDAEVKEICQNIMSTRDVHKTYSSASSHSPLQHRKNDGTNFSFLSSNGSTLTDYRMRRSTSPLSVGSQVSTHSRRSTSPYETERREQNGFITETTEC